MTYYKIVYLKYVQITIQDNEKKLNKNEPRILFL